MKLYHGNMSVCVQKVRVVLAEKNIEPTFHHMDIGAGDTHTPEYLKLNPKGVVPTLVVNDRPIVESTVICEYLDDAHPEVPLRPKDPYLLSQMRLWTMIPDAGLHLWCSTVSFAIAWRHQDRTEQMKKWSEEVKVERMETIEQGLDAPLFAPHLKNYVGVLKKMGKALKSSNWLVGDNFSLADIAMLPYVCRLDDMALNWIWEDDEEMRPIACWLARCRARKGYAGIEDFHDMQVVANMKRHGSESRKKIEQILSAS